MDEREAAAFGRGIAEGLGASLADALDQTVGPTGKAKLIERKRAEAAEERLNRRRERALEECRARVRLNRREVVDEVGKAVLHYCKELAGRIALDVGKDPRMLSRINYRERYAAFRKIGDRAVLLARIEQTIKQAEDIVQGASRLDAPSVYDQAARAYRAGLNRLAAVRVGPPKGESAQSASEVRVEKMRELIAACDRATVDGYQVAFDSFLEYADARFDELLGMTRAEYAPGARAAEDEAALAVLLDEVSESLSKEMQLQFAASAKAAEGTSMILEDLPPFEGKTVGELRFDPETVLALAHEVRVSFRSYRRCVMDNGLFSAFSEGSDYGKCFGFTDRYGAGWTDDFGFGQDGSEYFGEAPGSEEDREQDIPRMIPESEGGDSPAQALTRMRNLNNWPYAGLWDEGFIQSVDSFWYGFRKLMEFTRGLYRVDAHEFDGYRCAINHAVYQRSRALAVLMDGSQADEFCKRIKELERHLKKGKEVVV